MAESRPKIDYEEIVRAAKRLKPSEKKEAYEHLGEVSDHKSFYFNVTPESTDEATYFLNKFFAEEATRTNLQKLYKNHGRQAVNLSVIVGELDGRRVVFVVNTPFAEPKEKHKYKIISPKSLLIACIKKCNEEREDAHFEYITGDLETREHVEAAIANLRELSPKDRRITKPCAEKNLASALLKIYGKYGDRFKMKGMRNLYFYAFDEEDFSKRGIRGMRDKFDILDVPRIPSEAIIKVKKLPPQVLHLNNGRWTNTRDCCQDCQANKDAILSLCAATQGLASGRIERDITHEPHRRSISPDDRTLVLGTLEEIQKKIGRERFLALLKAANKQSEPTDAHKESFKSEIRERKLEDDKMVAHKSLEKVNRKRKRSESEERTPLAERASSEGEGPNKKRKTAEPFSLKWDESPSGRESRPDRPFSLKWSEDSFWGPKPDNKKTTTSTSDKLDRQNPKRKK